MIYCTHCVVLTVSLSRDVDDVHDMMDDISEQNEIAEEISSALSTPIGFNQEIDDVRNCDHNRQWSVHFGATIVVQEHSTV